MVILTKLLSSSRRKTIFMNLIKEVLLKDFTAPEAHRDRKLLTIQKDRKKVPTVAINVFFVVVINDCFRLLRLSEG